MKHFMTRNWHGFLALFAMLFIGSCQKEELSLDSYNLGTNLGDCDLLECMEETGWAGVTPGEGKAWWFYFDTQGDATQPIFAGKKETDGSVTWDGTNLIIDLGSWELQNVEEPVKVEGYNTLPLSRPAAGLFELYKGSELVIPGDGSQYYAIHLDIQLCPPCKVYLSESFGGTGDGSVLYTVDISDKTNANLTEVLNLTGELYKVTWDKPHIAVNPVDEKIFFINNGDGNHLGIWDGCTFSDLGAVTGLPADGTVLAAFDPYGNLFVANQNSNKIYEISTGITPTILNEWATGFSISGADMAFVGDELYLWTNDGRKLYKITFNGDGTITEVNIGSGNQGFTGLAYGDCTNNELLGSSNTADKLYKIDLTNGSTTAGYPFKLDGNPYDHIFGDMASGF